MAVYLLNTYDPRGENIILREDRYLGHIRARHVLVTVAGIRKAVEQPELITRDVDYPTRDNYHKPAMAVDMKALTAPNPQDIWASYDAETDSMTIFLTGRPVAGVHVHLGKMSTRLWTRPVGSRRERWSASPWRRGNGVRCRRIRRCARRGRRCARRYQQRRAPARCCGWWRCGW